MAGDLRQILALMGDQRVTFIAFAALLAYGAVLLSANGAGIGRLAALVVLCGSAAWLLLAMTGAIRRDLASWSPAAIVLLAIGMEGHAMSRSTDERRRKAGKRCETGRPPVGDDAQAVSSISAGSAERPRSMKALRAPGQPEPRPPANAASADAK